MPRFGDQEMPLRAFKKLKRRQFLAAVEALDALNVGAAFLPPGVAAAAHDAERQMRKALAAARKWWAKA